MPNGKIELYFFFILFLLVLGLSLLLFLPFFTPLALAAIFAVVFYPVFMWTKGALRIAHDGLAAAFVLLAIVLLLLVPLSFVSYLVFEEARSLFFSLSAGAGPDVGGLVEIIERSVRAYAPGFELDIRSYAQEGLAAITRSLGSVFAGTAQVALSLFIALIAFYYFLKDGERFRAALLSVSPLKDSYDERIFGRLHLAMVSVVRGSLFVALLQGLMTGVGFALFGVPNPVLWGALAGVAALVPTVGTGLVLVPAVAFLLATGSTAAAIGLSVWGFVAVGLIDNVLGPYLVGRGVHIHPLFVLLSALGGLSLFGPAGFILGPIVLALLLALASVYASLIKGGDVEAA